MYFQHLKKIYFRKKQIKCPWGPGGQIFFTEKHFFFISHFMLFFFLNI